MIKKTGGGHYWSGLNVSNHRQHHFLCHWIAPVCSLARGRPFHCSHNAHSAMRLIVALHLEGLTPFDAAETWYLRPGPCTSGRGAKRAAYGHCVWHANEKPWSSQQSTRGVRAARSRYMTKTQLSWGAGSVSRHRPRVHGGAGGAGGGGGAGEAALASVDAMSHCHVEWDGGGRQGAPLFPRRLLHSKSLRSASRATRNLGI